MHVCSEREYADVCLPLIDAHLNRFPLDLEPNMPKYFDGVWILSSNFQCCMCWMERPDHIQMVLVWNNTIKSSVGAKELVDFAKRYSAKRIKFHTHNDISLGTKRAFEKWGFKGVCADKDWTTYEYAG